MGNDTRICRFCGIEFHKVNFGLLEGDYDGTFNEGYCCKFHRKDHERQLIKEGKIDAPEIGNIVLKDKQYTDISGETVYFKEPYFDQSLRRKFNSIQEKAEFLNKQRIVDSGEQTLSKQKYKSELEKARYIAKGGKA